MKEVNIFDFCKNKIAERLENQLEDIEFIEKVCAAGGFQQS